MSDPALTGLPGGLGASEAVGQEPSWVIVTGTTNRAYLGQAIRRDERYTVDANDPAIREALARGYFAPLPAYEQPVLVTDPVTLGPMVATPPPFARQFQEGASGYDCRAVKRALVVALEKLTGPPTVANYGMDLVGLEFMEPAGTNLQAWKRDVGLTGDAIYTAEAHALLAPSFDSLGASLYIRQGVLVIAIRSVQLASLFGYSEAIGEAPGERDWWRVAPVTPTSDWAAVAAQRGKFTSDCSAHYIGCGEHAGIPPTVASGVMDSDAATALLLDDLDTITADEALPGDCVIWTGPDFPGGNHLTILIGGGRTVNNGGPDGAGPSYSTVAEQTAIQEQMGAPVLNYRRLPA